MLSWNRPPAACPTSLARDVLRAFFSLDELVDSIEAVTAAQSSACAEIFRSEADCAHRARQPGRIKIGAKTLPAE